MDSTIDQLQAATKLASAPSANWPDEVMPIFERAITTEYATLTARGAPLTYPVTPYVGEDGKTLDVSTGLTYPGKAERARRNPKVALLFSDPVGTGLRKPPVVLVQGMAAVRDADLQANMDRYLRLSFQKLPQAYAGIPAFMLRRMGWYYARIWIQVTPLRMLWWPEGNLERPAEVWEAPADLTIPQSDPAPQGKAPGAWNTGATDWQAGAELAIQKLGNPVLTLVDAQGFPLLMRVSGTRLTPTGFQFDLPKGYPETLLAGTMSGAACLTFHSHPEQFTGQQNMVFTGKVEADGSFTTGKQLGDWSLTGSKLEALWSFMGNGRKLAPRLAEEAQRRGQPVPVVNLPK